MVLFALAVHSVGEGHVGIVEHAEDGVRRAGHFTGGGEQLFLGGAEKVCTAAANVVQMPAVMLQLRLFGVEFFHGFIVDGHDLGRRKAGSGVQLDDGTHQVADHRLILGNAGILVLTAHRRISQCV